MIDIIDIFDDIIFYRLGRLVLSFINITVEHDSYRYELCTIPTTAVTIHSRYSEKC